MEQPGDSYRIKTGMEVKNLRNNKWHIERKNGIA